jgi:hypothetical protein
MDGSLQTTDYTAKNKQTHNDAPCVSIWWKTTLIYSTASTPISKQSEKTCSNESEKTISATPDWN